MAVPHVCPSGSVPHRSPHLLRISYRVELLAARRAMPMPLQQDPHPRRPVDGPKRPRLCSARARRRGAPGPGDHIAAPLVAKGIRCRCPIRGDTLATDSGPPPTCQVRAAPGWLRFARVGVTRLPLSVPLDRHLARRCSWQPTPLIDLDLVLAGGQQLRCPITLRRGQSGSLPPGVHGSADESAQAARAATPVFIPPAGLVTDNQQRLGASKHDGADTRLEPRLLERRRDPARSYRGRSEHPWSRSGGEVPGGWRHS
jgi:hypothetical protein